MICSERGTLTPPTDYKHSLIVEKEYAQELIRYPALLVLKFPAVCCNTQTALFTTTIESGSNAD
jgi:hypothetical protein